MNATLESPIAEPTARAVWLAARQSYLGATDVSAILGMNPYRSPLQVYAEKTGLADQEPENAQMRRGLRLEPYVAEQYTEETGRRIIKWTAPAMHPTKPFLGVNPDYQTGKGDTEFRLVECKTHTPFVAAKYGAPGTDQAPDWEVIQCQWQMHLTGYKHCDLAVLLGLDDFRIYPMTYDADLGQVLEDRATDWWHTYIEGKTPPPISDMKADANLLARMYPVDRDPPVYATDEIEEACIRLQHARAARIAAEKAEDLEEAVIKQFMKDAAYLETGVGRFSWKAPKGSPSWKAIAQALNPPQELIAEHTPPLGARRFLTPF